MEDQTSERMALRPDEMHELTLRCASGRPTVDGFLLGIVGCVFGSNLRDPKRYYGRISMIAASDSVAFEPIPQDSLLQLDRKQAQALADDLWSAGVRPTEAQHTSEHMQDMRKRLEKQDEVIGRLLNLAYDIAPARPYNKQVESCPPKP